MKLQTELSHGANAGLAQAVEWLEPLKNANPEISYGDLYTLAGVEAIRAMSGPQVRHDCSSTSAYHNKV